MSTPRRLGFAVAVVISFGASGCDGHGSAASPRSTRDALLGWPARGPFVHDATLLGSARRAWKEARVGLDVLWAGPVPVKGSSSVSRVVVEEALTRSGPRVAVVADGVVLSSSQLPRLAPPLLAFHGPGEATCGTGPCGQVMADITARPLVVLAAPGVDSITWHGSAALSDMQTSQAVSLVGGVGLVTANTTPSWFTVTAGDNTVRVTQGCDKVPAPAQSPVPVTLHVAGQGTGWRTVGHATPDQVADLAAEGGRCNAIAHIGVVWSGKLADGSPALLAQDGPVIPSGRDSEGAHTNLVGLYASRAASGLPGEIAIVAQGSDSVVVIARPGTQKIRWEQAGGQDRTAAGRVIVVAANSVRDAVVHITNEDGTTTDLSPSGLYRPHPPNA